MARATFVPRRLGRMLNPEYGYLRMMYGVLGNGYYPYYMNVA